MWCTTGNSLNINDIQYIFITSHLILYDRLIDNASVNEIIFISLTLLILFRKERVHKFGFWFAHSLPNSDSLINQWETCSWKGQLERTRSWKVRSWKVRSWKVSLKLERAKRSWKEPSEVWNNRTKLEKFFRSWKVSLQN